MPKRNIQMPKEALRCQKKHSDEVEIPVVMHKEIGMTSLSYRWLAFSHS